MSRQSTIRLMHDVAELSAEELDSLYGITVDADGSVWDNLEGKEFSSLFLWAEYTASQEEADDTFHKTGGGRWYDDD